MQPDWPGAAAALLAAEGPGIVLCDERALREAGLDAADWALTLRPGHWRGVLLVGLAVSARGLPRGVLPLYKPALPERVIETLQRALEAPPDDSARMELDPIAVPLGASGGPLQILLVEDNPVNQLVAQGMLERLGVNPVIASSGDEALTLFAARAPGDRFDLVLMDCQMPELDGLACTRRLREFEVHNGWPRVPVVAMTAHSEREAGPACRAAGMDDFLPKPVDLRLLAEVLRRWRHDPS